jgi:histidine phosphotransfer protein HptB
MPGMSGTQFMAALRRQTQPLRTPFIFHSAAGDDGEVRKIAAAYGVEAILAKPCPAHVLLAEIASALDATLRGPVPALPERLRARIPAYLAGCDEDVTAIELASAAEDFVRIQQIGHNLKGTGASYGFPRITRLGARLESAAKAGDRTEITTQLRDLTGYLRVIKAMSAEIAEPPRGVRAVPDSEQGPVDHRAPW